MTGQKLEDVTNFKYLRVTLSKDGTCSAAIQFSSVQRRIASAMATMTRLNGIWRCSTTSFASKFKFSKSLVSSILLCDCET